MLKPRETDIPVLFLVLVVLPLVTYILLGKWSEVSKKKERISLLAQLAAEEAFKAEAMAVATMAPSPAPAPALAPVVAPAPLLPQAPAMVTPMAAFVPLVPFAKSGVHECARCRGPATTRCARCKSVRYCSGKCQIIHWRQVHKQECQYLEYSNCGSPKSEDYYPVINNNERVLIDDESCCSGSSLKQPRHEKVHPDDTSVVITKERRSTEKHVSRKPKKETFRREDGNVLETTNMPSMDAYVRHKVKESNCLVEDEILDKNEKVFGGFSNGHATPRNAMHDYHNKSSPNQNRNTVDSRNTTGISNSVNSGKHGRNSHDMEMGGTNLSDETSELKKCNKSKMYKSPKSVKATREQSCSDMDKKGQILDESNFTRTRDTVVPQGTNGVTSMGIMKMIGLMRPSKPEKFDGSEHNSDKHKKVKMLFPYDEFVKFFQCDVYDFSPRGLINCGNSCYANAVLQCLTCTKPLTIYLLSRSHSRACCGKDWCLMCELEQHVMMLRESGGGPMSPGGILLHMRSLNGQIGGGSQEDAHEFLRLLVTSMQSICLEGLGGENVVDPRLQETTFIQHTFGGRLRSKVKCLRCHHESERYENIMDLTLEIFGWVESLEDALTQFTSAEDLDGENMYRCGRCSTYVRARKQLSIQEAPNILTIVLKRFQEGKYGKINKCITFSDMLDMIPYMTGTDDIPPLYVLYAVVVHLDMLNASFSGHYISYVKDLQGNWFRIDDTEVQSVPASQVMSEGAYMLFYMRSYPRPARGKPARHNAPSFAKQWTSKTAPKSSRSGHSKSSCHIVSPGLSSEASRNVEFSDATSSDRSFFTSSDEASFTTESTRDSFSTVDYADTVDPFSSIFNTLYTPEYSSSKTVLCNRFSGSRPQSRFVLAEEKSSVMDPVEAFPSDNNSIYVKYHSSKDGTRRTSCKL